MEANRYLYGASGHCKVIIDILKRNQKEISAIFDDKPLMDCLNGIPVLQASKMNISSNDEMIVSIGNNNIRKKIATKMQAIFLTAIHDKAIISENSKIGNGSVVMAGGIINTDVEIGNHCIINTGAVIDHDCKIDDYCHISPNVSLAGNVNVGEGAHIGIGACVIQGIKIGKWTTIGAGAVIVKDIPDFAIVVGNPGKIIKYNIVNE